MIVENGKKKAVKNQRELTKQIRESIIDHINERNDATTSVGKGDGFCEWILYNIFELREDEVIDATEISGKFDNGIDAIFEYNNEICVLQSKYNNSHNIDSIQRFIADCQRVVLEKPFTERGIVLEMCKKVREFYENNETINCYYITNSEINEWEQSQVDSSLKNSNERFNNLKFNFYDFDDIQENIEIKKGMLPKAFREKRLYLPIEESFSTFETSVAKVKLRDLANFVNEGGNTLFHSNIRNFLKGTNINKGIKKTLNEEPEKFWFYNNGVTIVCDEYDERNSGLKIKAPQIVNGCQTAKTIADYFKYNTKRELNSSQPQGHLMVKIIRTKPSANENDKKDLRDNITRYTNSQNAVKGLDFYALDRFQRDLKDQFRHLGFYYEIQRGSFITLSPSEQKSYKGLTAYNYLLLDVKGSKKFVLPAKEVIQAFTAAIKQMPNIAYGRANELTPVGSRWDEIINEKLKTYL